MGAFVQYAHRWNVEMAEVPVSTVCQTLDSLMTHDAVVSRTATMMGASVQQARRWNIEMVELHISTVCQTLDSRMLGVVNALLSTMCQKKIPTSNCLHISM